MTGHTTIHLELAKGRLGLETPMLLSSTTASDVVGAPDIGGWLVSVRNLTFVRAAALAIAVGLSAGLVTPASAALAQPDLVTTAVSDPPAVLEQGDSFSVTATTANIGDADAGTSITSYILKRVGAERPLTGGSKVLAIAAGGSRTTTRIVTVTDNQGLGIYNVLACADNGTDVEESDEFNNCLASTGVVEIVASTRPDLIVDNPSVPSPYQATIGQAVDVSAGTRNIRPSPSPASVTRYYLSLDRLIGSSDELLVGVSRIPALDGFSSAFGTRRVGIPTDVTPDSYFLLGCADDLQTVDELKEANNCTASARKILVSSPTR